LKTVPSLIHIGLYVAGLPFRLGYFLTGIIDSEDITL